MQLLNALVPISVIFFGIIIFLRFVQFSNTILFIFVNVSGKVTVSSPAHCANVSDGNSIRLFGKFTSANFSHP